VRPLSASPERTFAAIALVAGGFLALAMPPGAAPDETRHLSRVYVMSEGFFGVPGLKPPRVRIPKSIPDLYRAIEGEDYQHPPRHTVGEMIGFLGRPLDPERRVGIANAGTYTPIVYLPHLVGVAPGRWLGLSPAGLIYLGRFTSLLAWVALTALAIRVAPARKWTLVLLALTPMSIASAASISGDPMTNVATLLFTVFAMRAICGKGALAASEVAALLGTALFVGVAKPGYWPLALAALAIPRARSGGRGRQLALAAAVAAAIAAPSLGWIAFAQLSAPAPPIAGSDPMAQLGFVLGNPLAFAGVLARTLAETGSVYWSSFVGTLGPLIVKLPAVFYVAWAFALVVAIAMDGPSAAVDRNGRGWLGVAFALSIATMFAMAYLGWNPVGAPVIRGVQGRYWAPAVPMLVFALPAWRSPLPVAVRATLLGVVAASLIAAIAAVCATYYRA
jgi:uncharacterized membrane protein